MRVWLGVCVLWALAVAGPLRAENLADIEPEAGGAVRENFVLNTAEVKAGKAAFKQARRGEKPDLATVPEILHGPVMAAYLLGPHGATATELNAWLTRYPDVAVAGKVYSLAEDKRARPKQVCKTKTVKVKVKGKKKPKTTKKQVCHTEGSWGPMPPATAAMKEREARKVAVQQAQERRRAAMGAEGRALAAKVWRLRSKGDYTGALNLLLASGSRLAMGGAYWQEELVKLADYYHGKREWMPTYVAASAAAGAQGPERDEALWLAGFAAYRMGERGKAAGYWERLVREEPKTGAHYGRAAWWAARVLEDLGEGRKARALLEAGAEAPLTFYGQLAAMKLGREAKLDFSAPGVDSTGLELLLQNKQARRGLALAQLGEKDWAEAELRAVTSKLPVQANRALAGIAVTYDLPSTALRASRDALEKGEVMPAALFPLPQWKPQGGWQYDQAMILGLMRQESAFQPAIGSAVGAQGLMQIMPSTGRYIAGMTGRDYGGVKDLHKPAVNLAMAQDYLNYLGNKLDGNRLLVAAAYNGGIGNVQRWMAKGITPIEDPMMWIESIPFDETRDYVEKVFLNTWIYQQRLGQPRRTLSALSQHKWPQEKAQW